MSKINVHEVDQLPVASSKQVLASIASAAAANKWRYCLSLLLMITSAGAVLACTYILGVVIDILTGANSHTSLDTVGIIVGSLVLVASLAAYYGRWNLALAVEPTLARLRQRAFGFAVNLRLDTIERVGTADPLARLTGDVGTITDTAHEVAPQTIVSGVTIVTTVIALFIASTKLGLVSLIGLAPEVLLARWFVKASRSVSLDEANSNASVTSEIYEAAQGASTIRAFSAADRWQAKIDAALDAQWHSAWPPARKRCLLFPGSTINVLIALFAVLGYGYILNQRGQATIGLVSVAGLYIIRLLNPLAQICDTLDNLQKGIAASRRLIGVCLADQYDSHRPKNLPQDGKVVVDNVHFAYPDSYEILHGISLEIQAGERVAIVGPSGAGKSTIAKLVTGIHEPDCGTITVGGIGVGEISQTLERRSIALVTQESHVFLGSIADNCRLGRLEASHDDIVDALQAVHAMGWVDDLPEGVHTAVGHTGLGLTLAQAQQLALARVLLADPLVVILDEATAGLGTDAAQGIERAFAAVLEGRTVITIAHRLDVAAVSDRVIVVDRGNVETGTHDELISRQDSTYAQLWQSWMTRS